MGVDLGRGSVVQVEAEGLDREVARAQRRREFEALFTSEPAFRRFYDRALPQVYGYLLHRCSGDSTLAEDLAQSTFTEAVRHRRDYDGEAEPVTWMVGIARHKLVDHLRQSSRSDQRLMRLAVREITVGEGADPWRAADDRQLLEQALARLPSDQRIALVLHHADGLPVREVARLMHRSESAAESLLSRAMAALRAVWREVGDD